MDGGKKGGVVAQLLLLTLFQYQSKKYFKTRG